MKRQIIIAADDFGFSEAFNIGAVKACRKGVATVLNLLCNMPATENAIEIWKKECPHIQLTAHINFVQGRPVSAPEDIRSLVDENGNFYRSRCWKSDLNDSDKCKGNIYPDEEDLYRECMAQLNRFESLTGVRPAHFDAHSVMTKAMARAFERVGKQTGIHNPVSQEKQPDRFVMVYELPMLDRDGSSILSRGARPEDWLNDSAGLLECPHPINVLHFHPGYVDKYILEHSSLTTPRCYDLETLCDPSVKEWIQKNQIILTDFDHVLADRQS